MIGIYKITNKVNGKIYIGQSINIEKRIHEHFWKASCEKDVSFNSILHIAIRKYGKEQFITEVLEECSVEELDDKEKYYIHYYNSITPNGYNILSGGQKKRSEVHFCSKCGRPIYKYSKTGLCQDCYKQVNREHIPSADELIKILKQYSGNFSKTGRHFHVTDNAIRKWCKSYNLPYHSKDYKD